MGIPKIFKTLLKPSVRTPNRTKGPGKKVAEGEFVKRPKGGRSVFGNKPFTNRQRFRRELKKMPSAIPGGGKYTMKERLALEEELFPKEKYGQYITPYEISRRIRLLKRERSREKTGAGKIKIRRQIRFLEQLKGEEKDEK